MAGLRVQEKRLVGEKTKSLKLKFKEGLLWEPSPLGWGITSMTVGYGDIAFFTISTMSTGHSIPGAGLSVRHGLRFFPRNLNSVHRAMRHRVGGSFYLMVARG
jgi:hypothetical protein